MHTFDFIATSPNDTDRLGEALAAALPAGTTIALLGTLGAGKTFLVQSLAAGLGVPRESVVSPTFVLCQQYSGRRMLYHLDAYRINDDDEFLQLGVDEMFDSDAIVLIEWADRIARCLPREHVEIRVEVIGDESRTFQISSIGEKYDTVIDQLAQRLSAK